MATVLIMDPSGGRIQPPPVEFLLVIGGGIHKMATDPTTGRELPEGFIIRHLVPGWPFGVPAVVGEVFQYEPVVIAQDRYDRDLPRDISDRIVRGWRHWNTAPRSARLAYTAWKVSRMKAPGKISLP